MRALLFFLLLLTSGVIHAASINEVRIDQTSNDDDEYVELLGLDGESLNNLTYIVIGDGSAGDSGIIESVSSLSGNSIGSDGLFLIAESSFSIGGVLPDLIATLNFENSDNVTHLLVSGFSGANGDDLDSDDDGILDTAPWASIVDSLALIENEPGVAGEHVYSDNRVGPDGSFVPGHIYRCADGFNIGIFDPSATNAVDTPAAPNPCPILINEIRTDQPSSDLDEYVELIGLANADLTGLTHIVIGDDSSRSSGVIESVVNLDGQSFSPTGYFTIASSLTLLNNTVTPEFPGASLVLENSDNVTHLLVSGFTGAITDDLDNNDDGTFDSTPWVEIIDSVSLVETDPSIEGVQLYSANRVGPDGTFVPGHVFRCDSGFEIGQFDPASQDAVDTPSAANICITIGDGGSDPVSATIPEIQSNLADSPLNGQTVDTSGIVTAVFTGSDELNGFYLQDPIGDSDVTTSDGVFVFYPNGSVALEVGDQITITAEVTEFFGLTELTNVSNVQVNSSGNTLPDPVLVTLPESVDGELEQYEGMLVEIGVEMTISQNFFLSRFGQMTLSSPDDAGNAGRLFQPTNQHPANSAEAIALAEENARRILILDDGQDISSFGDNPVPVPYIGLDPVSVIRAGDTVTNLIGVLDFGRINANTPPSRDYRIHPTQAPVFTPSNPRTNAPEETNGNLTVASFNVLNYFTTLDGNGDICGPFASVGCRGADSSEELVRQEAKLVSAITAINADIVGLIEIENNGFGASSAIQNLVDAINANLGSAVYQVLPVNEGVTPGLGGDAITVGFIFKPASVQSTGVVAILDTGSFSDDITDGGFSRQPIAASFEDNSTGEVFTAVVNHFKSKNPPSTPLGDGNDDQGDGQGAFNLRRTEAANDLIAWLATDPTGVNDPDILIIGDLNAYAQEDPILAFTANGYTDLVKQLNGDESYTFTFDGLAGSLDHALATSSMANMVSGVTHWHINTDEPPVLDYNTEFNPEGYYQPNSFRASDHDAVIIGIDFSGTESCYVVPAQNGNIVTFCL